jgi:pimeloyl-ACP methyl ester carboxylesterase
MPSLHDRAVFVEVDVSGERVRLSTLHLPALEGGRRFLLLHGNPSHMDHFAANIEWLRRHGDVALFDAPGFGASPVPRHALSLDFLAEVAAAYAHSLGWPSGVDVIGQSHGGAVAQTLAAREPGLVRSVVLFGSMGYPAHLSMRLARLPGAAAVTVGIARRANRFPFGAPARAFARTLLKASFEPDPVPEGFMDAELAHVLANPEIQRSSVRVNDGDPTRQLASQADRIAAPILVVHGRGDRLVPIAYARRLFDRIGHRHPRSRMIELDGGHMFHLTRPEAVHAVLERWLGDPPLVLETCARA